MNAHGPDALLAGKEAAEPGHPGERRERRTDERELREHGAPPRVLGHERVQVVAAAAGVDDVAKPVSVPSERPVEVGLVADLERRDVAAADPLDQCLRLGRRQRRAVAGEVDAQDQLRPEVGGQGPCGPHPPLRQRVADPAARDHAAHRPPRPIRAVASDPQHRRLPRVEVADQLHHHRVDRERVAAGVLVDGLVLERQAEETGWQCLARRAVTDCRRQRRHLGRGSPGAGRHYQQRPDRRHGLYPCSAAKHAIMVAYACPQLPSSFEYGTNTRARRDARGAGFRR